MSEQPVVVSGRLGVVWVTGPDTVSFLDGLLSQNIAAISVGETGRTLLLAPNGKLRGILFVLRGDGRVGLVGDAANAEAVAADLRRFKIRVDVDINTDPRQVTEIWGDYPGQVVVPEAGRWVEDGESVRFRMPFQHAATDRIVVIGGDEGRELQSPDDFDALRIELGEPVVGVDLDEKTIPQEGVAVDQYVDFTKGCYLGQELVARIDSRGHVNRRLAGLVITGDESPAPGAAVTKDGQAMGAVTSAAFSTRLGSVVALAMVRAEIAEGETVAVAGCRARVTALPIIR